MSIDATKHNDLEYRNEQFLKKETICSKEIIKKEQAKSPEPQIYGYGQDSLVLVALCDSIYGYNYITHWGFSQPDIWNVTLSENDFSLTCLDSSTDLDDSINNNGNKLVGSIPDKQQLSRYDQDSLALVALYNATNGDNWTTSWDLSQPIRTWHGVTLSDNGCRVIGLDLSNSLGDSVNSNGNNLVGFIPSEIGNLTELRYLSLASNNITGNIPLEYDYRRNTRFFRN